MRSSYLRQIERNIACRVGATCRRVRAARRMSTGYVAHAMNVSTGTVLSWERGDREMSVVQLLALATVLGVPARDLLTGGS